MRYSNRSVTWAFALLLVAAGNANAHLSPGTDNACLREVAVVYTGLRNDQNVLWVCFKNDLGCVVQDIDDSSDAQIDRTLSVATTALVKGIPVAVRYSGGTCPTTGGTKPSQGMWLNSTRVHRHEHQ